MKSMRHLLLVGTILFWLWPVIALANEEGDDQTVRKGWYAGVGATWAIHTFKDDIEKRFAGLVDVDDTAGFMLRGGYRRNKYLSLEFMYEYLDGFDVKVLGVKLFKIQSNTFTGNFKLYYPIKNWHPYILGGIGGSYYNIKDRSGTGLFVSDTSGAFAGRAGVGVDLYINKNWLVFLETTTVLTTHNLDSPTGSGLSPNQFISIPIGIQYRF